MNPNEQPPRYDLEKARTEADEMKKMIAEGEAEDYKDADNKIEKGKEEYIKKAQEKYDYARKEVAKNPNESISHQLSSYFGIQGNCDCLYPGISETYEIAEKIVDESVQVEVGRERINNLNYIIRGILEYNLDKTNKDNSSKFTFKPKSLEQEALIRRKGEDLDEDLAEFCKSKNPIEYIKYIIENEREFPDLEPEKIVELIDLARGHIEEEELDNYTKKHMDGEIAENLIKKSMQAKNLKSFAEGIYVDVDGTLIQKGKLNKTLMDYLISTSNNVTIFTNGDPEGKTNELRDLGMPEKLLPVKSKEQYRGILLEKVFDDQPLNYQGFDGLIHVNPEEYILEGNYFEEYETEGELSTSLEYMDKPAKEILNEKFISDEEMIKYHPKFVAKKKAQLKILSELKEIQNNK